MITQFLHLITKYPLLTVIIFCYVAFITGMIILYIVENKRGK